MDICQCPHLPANPGLLKKKLFYPGSLYHTILIEVDINVFPEAAWVVISNCLGISKSWWATEIVSWLLHLMNIKSFFYAVLFLLLVFYMLCSKWSADKHWRMSSLKLPPKERGRPTVHPDNWVLKDIFKWSTCSLYLASQESWESLKTSRRTYWEHTWSFYRERWVSQGAPL